MKTKISILFAALMATAVYSVSGQRGASAKMNDFRDAVADEGSQDFNTAIPHIDKNYTGIPVPAVPQRQEQSLDASGQKGVSKPFIKVEMLSSAVAGRTPHETRSNVAAFFGEFGLKIIACQDNDAYSTAQLDFRKPTGMIDAAQLAWAKNQILGEIKGLPEVKELRTVKMADRSYYRAMFSGEGAYSRRIREIFSRYPDLTVTLRPLSSEMIGTVWVRLSAETMDKAQANATAAKLKSQFPNIISSSEVSIAVTLMDAGMGTR